MKKVNKSQLIREYLASSRDKSPVSVVKALGAKGVKVSPGLVSVVKHGRMKAFSTRRLVRHAEALAKHSSALADARRFVERAGGLEEALSLVEIVGKIMG